MFVFIDVLAFEMAMDLPIKNIIIRIVTVYIVTLGCTFITVWSTHYIEPLAESAYKDVFINYTGLFIVVTIIMLLVQKKRHK